MDLLSYIKDLQITNEGGTSYIKDTIRKKKIILLPEELVRQCTIQYLIQEMSYPIGKIQIERQIQVNNTIRRYDIIVYDKQIQPFLLIECKSHKVNLSQDTFDQIARYNLTMKAPYLLVTNGMNSFCCNINHDQAEYYFCDKLPEFPTQ